MKMIIVALALVAVALAAEVPVAQILRSESDQQPNGAYNFNFETDDGTVREEVGEVKEVLDEDNKPQQVVVVRGSYQYTNPDGKKDSINYYADETGFHADGESIPKPTRR